MKNAMSGVVPQPGATFPYSEFSGFSRVPRFVTNPSLVALCLIFTGIFDVTIGGGKEKERSNKVLQVMDW
jgi:hypothetical protein